MADPVIDFQPEEQQFDFQPAGATSAPVDSAKLPPEVLRAIGSVPYHPPRMEFSPVAPIPDMPGEAPYSMKRAITGGMTDVLTAPTSGAETGIAPIGPEVSGGVEDVQTPGRRGKGALRLAAAGLDAATPFVGPAIFESPLNVARGFGEGYLAGKGARYVAKKSGADPETQDLAESVGQLGPLVGESVLRPRFGVASTPEATTASAGVRGAGAGVAVTPEAVTVRGKVGPLEGSKTFARKAKPAEAPTLTPQTIEGELAKNPATRDEIADAQVATNYAGPEQAKAAVVAKRQAQASAVPPGGAEKPAGAEKTPAATPTQTVRVQSENDNNKISSRENVGSQPTEQIPSGEPEVSDHAAQRSAIKAGSLGDAGAERVVHLGEGTPENPGRASGIIGKPTAKPRTNGEPLEHGFDFRPAEDVGTAVREATQKTNGALPRDERRKVERTPEEQQTQTLFKQARTELGEDASSDQVMARVDELKKAPVDFQADLYKHRSTQVNIPKDSEAHSALESARQRIADGDLAGDGKDIGGNHVTVRWGLTAPDDDKLEKLKSYISSLTPFEATLGKTEKFKPSESSDGAAVIQSPIEAPELGKINSELAKHAPFTEPTFKSYTPHATIAYVKPEKADRYTGMSVTQGKKFQVKSIAISDRQGNHEEVKLEGKPGTKYVLPSFATHGLTKGAAPEKLTNEELNKAYSRQKSALTKAENLTDDQARKFAVLKAATHAVNEWEDKFDGKWPDNWSRWQRSLDDAYHKFNHALGTSDQPPRLEDLVGKDVDSEVMKAALGGTTKKQPMTKAEKPKGKYEVAVPADVRDGVHVIDTSGPSTKTVASGFKSKAEAQDWIDTRQSEATPAETAENPETAESGGASGLVNAVYDKLKAGQSLGNVIELTKLAEEHFGSSRVSGNWTPKDMFDAMEAGVNKYLLDEGKELMEMGAKPALMRLRQLMSRLTAQGTRTEEQIKNQQFSTPPTESYVAAKVAGLKPSDVVLEPSAGNGGLAVWAKAIGAKVYVNEISERRQQMLEAAGFDKPTSHDGELINALLDQKIKPTVVLMNPPFSASTLKSHEAKNRNQYGFNHVDQALQRLEPGGRLVAILGGGQANEPNGGASLTGGKSGEWFKKLGSQYKIRANVRVHGKEYQKYGTSFATRIIVIDKVPPTPGLAILDVVSGNYDTLEEAYTALSKVPARAAIGGSDVTSRSEREVPAARPGSPESTGLTESPAGRGADSPVGQPSHGVRPGSGAEDRGPLQPADRLHGPDRSSGTVRPQQADQRVPLDESQPQPGGPAQTEAARDLRSAGENADEKRPLQLPEVEGLTLGREKQEASEQEDSSAYVTYKPTLKGPKHPGSIVESKTMATVPLPEITYKPSLPDSVISQGKLSAVQLEAISIAGQQNDIVLPSGHRASALVGDGTGVGKGRIGAGILWDNYRKGRKRLVWVSEKWDLMEDAKRDFNGIGAIEMAGKIKAFQKYNVTDPIDHEGVLFTTYALIRSADKKGNTRANQLQKWLAGDDAANGGYMLFDESHNLKNAITGSAQTPPSEIGQTVRTLLDKNPNLRTTSLSATAATDVMNLGYLDRLGLWGAGTSFPNGFGEFAAQISGGGISAMEMVARELKSQGKYLSRTLSFKGVTYKETEHKLTAEQKELYRTATKAWASVVQQAESTIEKTTNGGSRAVARFMSLFYGAQLRFFNVLLTTLKIPTAVEQANKALAEGKSVVITLVNTNEAAQNREKNKERVASEDEDEPPDYDFGPAEMLTDLVEQHYPTQQYADDVDSEGREIKVPVVDADGNPVQNPEAIRQRDQLVKDIKRDLKLPSNPLDILINSFGGPSKAAELTGRKERYDEALGKFVKRGDPSVKRDQVNLSEMRGFQAGKKRVAILSNAAGTGISLHADVNAENQQKRHHITLQMGWSADKAMQMLGRTHRANQVHPPEYNTIVTDLGGEKRFSATIAKRLGSLGALSKGQKNAVSGSEGMDKVNFESDQGRKAVNTFYQRTLANAPIPGTEGPDGRPLTGMTVLNALRVLKTDSKTGIKTVPDADRTNVTRLLNRLLALDPAVQNPVYEYFYDIFGAVVQQAVEDGTLDTGVKELPGDEFSITGEKALSKDPKTGAETFYYPIEAKEKTDRMPAAKIAAQLKGENLTHKRLLRSEKGKLVFARDARDIVHASGHSTPASYIVTPADGTNKKVESYKLNDYAEVREAAKQAVEKAQTGIETAKRSVEHYENTIKNYPKYEAHYRPSLEDAISRVEKAQQALKEAEAAAIDPHAAALEEWEKQYNEAPDHTTEEHHLIGGAVLRWWNQIREAANEHLNIYTAVDSKTGKRVVGVEVPADGIRKLLARISGNASTVSQGQLATDVMKNNLSYTLEQNIQVRKGRVNGKPVLQLMPPNDAIATNLKRLGVIYERGAVPVYYVPTTVLYGGTVQVNQAVLDKVLKEYPVKQDEESAADRLRGESGTFTPSALNPKNVKKVYRDFIDRVIDQTLDLGDKYRRVAEHDPVIAKMLHEKDHAPRYFRDKAQSNVDQVTKGLSEPQIRLVAMMADSDAREYLEENHPEQFEEAEDDPAVMAAVNQFKQYQQELSALRINLGWHVRRNLSMVETESGEWEVIDRNGDPVETFKKARDAQEYVEDNGNILDHLKRTYPEHLREPLMGRTDSGPNVSSGSYGGIRPPKPDKKQRLATGEYFYEHGAKDFSGYLQSFTQASHATLNKKIYDQLTEEAQPWQAGTAQPSDITYHGKTYYRPDVALSMRSGIGVNKVAHPLEYRAYDPAKDDKLLIKSFEDGWGTMTTGKPGISIHDRWLAPKEVVEALDNYDTTRGALEHDSIRRFFQEQIVGLFGPTVHMLNIMRRLAHTVGTGAWDPRVWPYYQKLFFSPELRERMADGLADDTIDALSKYGTYTNSRDIGSLHSYFLGNMNPANWVRQTIGKFSKGLLFDPKFMGGFGGMDQKARVLAFDFLKEHEGMDEEEASKNVDDGFGNYNRASWTERMKRWARVLLFPGWDFSSLKWFLRHPFKTAMAPALVTLAANLAVNRAGKNKDQDKYDFGYLHYGDRKFRTSLFTEAMALHLAEPVLSAGRAALEGGNAQDVGSAAGEGLIRGAGGLASSLRPEIQMATELLSNRQYAGGTKEIWKPEDASLPGKVLPNRKLDKLAAFAAVKALPAINRFLDSSYDNVDMATGVGSVLGVTNYRSGAEERLRANVAKAKGYSETLAALAEHDPAAAEKYSLDPTKAVLLVFHGDLSQLSADLKQIDAEKEQVGLAPGIAKEARKQMLEQLAGARQQVLTSADALDDALTAAKLRMKKGGE